MSKFCIIYFICISVSLLTQLRLCSYPALCSFLDHLSLNQFGGMHTSVTSAWGFVEAIDQHLVDRLIGKLAACPFFGLSLDESTSRCVEKYISVDCHMWEPSVGRSVEVLEFTLLSDCTSQGVFDKTLQILSKFQINNPQKFVGAASDGASVFTGALLQLQ